MFYDDCQTHREKAGLKKAHIAKQAGISASTMANIEKHVPSTTETLMRVINALNTLHYEKKNDPLDPEKLITSKSRFGTGIPSRKTA